MVAARDIMNKMGRGEARTFNIVTPVRLERLCSSSRPVFEIIAVVASDPSSLMA
jgi:hypothetical protein